MTVVFDAEALLAFSFDEPGATEVESWLDRIYDSEVDGYVTTINLAEFRYIATRITSQKTADSHIDDLLEMGIKEYGIDHLWRSAASLKALYSPSIGDGYAVAAAKAIEDDVGNATLIVGADDDYDVFQEQEGLSHLIERFRDEPA